MPNLAHPDLLLLVLYAVSEHFRERLSPWPQRWHRARRIWAVANPPLLLVMFQGLPGALVLWFLSYNCFMTGWLWRWNRRHPALTQNAQKTVS